MTEKRTHRIGLAIGALTYGGAERQLVELLRRLDRQRFDPVVYCISDKTEPFGPQLEGLGVTVRVLGREAKTDLGRAMALAKAVRRDRIELLHSWLYIGNMYAVLARLTGAVRRFVPSARSCTTKGGMHLRVLNVVAFRCADRIVCNAHRVGAYIVSKYLAPRAKVEVVHNGLDLERFSPRPGSHGDGLRIGTVGRLVPLKNLPMFIEAAALVRAECPTAMFYIVGVGPERAPMEQLVRERGLADAVCFLGERHDVPALLQEWDLFWLTSLWEGLPNVVLEAMACGLPVISTDVGGVSEIIHDGTDGIVIPSGAADQLARHSLALIQDTTLRRAMGAAARLRAQAFSLERMTGAFERLYAQVLEPQKAAA